MKNSAILGSILLGASVFLSACQMVPSPLTPTPVPSPEASASPEPVTSTSEVEMSFPKAGDTIESPLEIRGQAPGNWFFEAEMTATLRGAEGPILSTEPLTAQGEWMTSELVPFTGKMTFLIPPDMEEAVLVIENSNPSGLPENAKSLEIPVLLRQK